MDYSSLFDIWNNNACLGYAIKAMENTGVDNATIKNVVEEIKYLFDIRTVEEAVDIYLKSHY